MRADRRLVSTVLASALVAAALGSAGLPAHAADYTGPVKILVGFPAGGATDGVARILAEKLQPLLNQPVFIDNKGGAGGMIATQQLKAAPADGSTVMLTIDHTHVIIPLTFKAPGYDPAHDFTPLAGIATYYNALGVSSGLNIKTLPEFGAWMKANPDKAKVATSGRGSAQEMAAEMFRMASGTPMLLVPYKGSSAAHPDLLAGRTALYIDTISAIQSQVKAGNARAIAVSTLKRTSALPDVPTADEQGLKGYDANTNGGFLAPAGTPKAIVSKLNAEINAALKLPDVRAKLVAAGIEIQGGTPQEYADLIKSDLAKWGKVVKEAGIAAE